MHDRRYRTGSAYAYDGNAARKIRRDWDEPEQQRRKPQHVQKKAQAIKKTNVRMSRKAKLKLVAALAMVFSLVLLVVYRYVAIWESGAQAEQIKNSYNEIVSENEAIQAQINSGVDLKELEKIAHERLGMVRPERYQMFYIDMENNDSSETVEKSDTEPQQSPAPISSVPGMLISAFELLK